MLIKQLSIFVENRPGRLSEITSILHKNNIDIRALSIADTTDFGILRLIVDSTDLAEEVIRGAGYTVSQTDVIAIGVADKPGGLASALQCMYENKISVEYMYAFVSRKADTAFVIMRVDNAQAAIDALQKQGTELLTTKDIYNM